mmetsp:Transcript_46726/g.111240  ORF Transcript_46726/g.111240 Transcript_46726/m.111240 type:complete len:521 (-) Transcript_46726:276-1838(-)
MSALAYEHVATKDAPWPVADCDMINGGDTAWVLVSMALVLFMTPGLAFFYGGLVHRGSVLTIIMQCIVSMGLTAIIWFFLGFSLAFGESAGGIIGNPASYPLFLSLDPCTPAGYPMQSSGTIPGLLFAGYQMMFACITPALITGAFADRVTFPAYLLFISLWIILVYCPFAHWIWNSNGFLNQWGVWDFAGGIVVHISAGFAALASIFVVGSRKYASEEERTALQVPHNRTFVALGTGMLWFGWFGFNGGSALSAGGMAVFAVVNTCVSAGVAMFLWILIEWAHVGKPSVVGACIGAIAGLATITPCAGFVRPWAAFVIGVVAAFFCYGCVLLRDVFKWDDALDVWAVHGMGGWIGSILIGVFADPILGGPAASGEQFAKQLAAAVGTAVYSFIVSFVLLHLVNLITPVVPSDADIAEGLDSSMHGEHAYDEDAIKAKANKGGWGDDQEITSEYPQQAHVQPQFFTQEPQQPPQQFVQAPPVQMVQMQQQQPYSYPPMQQQQPQPQQVIYTDQQGLYNAY